MMRGLRRMFMAHNGKRRAHRDEQGTAFASTSTSLVISEIDSSATTLLQAVKLLALHLTGDKDAGKISGTTWIEEVVLHSTTAASKSGEAIQRKMAQPFEAKHQGNQLPVPPVPIIGKGVL
ncbi:hypothetical protein ZEAMMB73_Zm00001d047619 [Zea mays]|uniref:Uncharacterized protein n=2 Tax=Zea mays TaxID=4577 RepID=A0A1D6PBX6_MAIZE|nr:hypothetical protein ZEAMMB73_Zm00001d047619 [Zea mays]